MKRIRRFIGLAALTTTVVWTGCGDRRHAGSDDEEHSERDPMTAEHGFKKNHGVFVSPEIRRAIGLELGEPAEKAVSRRIEVLARVYATGKATALLDSETAATLAVGQPAELTTASNHTIPGTLVRIDRQLEGAMGQVEALMEFTPDESLESGSVVRAAFRLRDEQGVVAVPQNSVLRTGEGAFVFVLNGDHFQRARVQTGRVEDSWVQITDGLLAGDVIATNGVQGLWCIELQATKGGAACCPAPLEK